MMVPYHRTAFAIAATMFAGLSSAQTPPDADSLGATPPATEAESAVVANPAEAPAAPPVEANAAPLSTVPVSSAETPEAGDVPRESRSRLIEEIIVTSQKREQNLFEVPQAVVAISGDKLEAMGVESVQDLTKVTPGLAISNTVGFNLVYLRGVGTDAITASADSSVPFYMDGIPLLAAQGSVDTLGRVARVEVLKGPQGTLFGTNSTGGAINIITPEPERILSGNLSAGLGNYGLRSVQTLVNIPVGDDFAATVNGYVIDQDNFYTNDDPNGPEAIATYAKGARGKALWDITDYLSNTFYASIQKNSSNGGLNFENTTVWPAFSLLLPQDPKADRHYSMNSRSGAQLQANLLANTLALRTETVDVKLIGSWQKLRAYGYADFDASSTPLANAYTPGQLSKQYTGELQFSSNEGTFFSEYFTWVGGLFYIYSFNGLDPVQLGLGPGALQILAGEDFGGLLNELTSPATQALLGYDLNDGALVNTYGRVSGSTVAEYLQGTVHLSEHWKLILGQRYQYTERKLDNSRTTVPTAEGEITLLRGEAEKLTAKQLSPRIGLQWFFSENANAYASWARGYKSPTYNTVNLTQEAFNPITPLKANRVDSYEIGLKSQWLDKTLQFNPAIFYIEQKNLLTGFISVLTGGIFSYDNTPAARIYGAEFDSLWLPMPEDNPGLVLTAAVTYLDTEYTKYPNGRGWTEAGVPYGEGFITPPLPPKDFSGNRIARTPELTYNLGASQTLELDESSSLEVAVDLAYSSGFFFLPQSEKDYEQEAHYLLNAQATYFYHPFDIQLVGWGKNILSKDYVESIFTSEFGRNEMLASPRTYGLSLKWKF